MISAAEYAAEYLRERLDWLEVSVVWSDVRKGWDVVLRLDGTYSIRGDADGAAELTRREIKNLPDVG